MFFCCADLPIEGTPCHLEVSSCRASSDTMSGVARKETGTGKKFQAYNVNDTYKGGRPESKASGSK